MEQLHVHPVYGKIRGDQRTCVQVLQMKQNLPDLLKNLGMNPAVPREIPHNALDQIQKILELAGINETLEKIEEMDL